MLKLSRNGLGVLSSQYKSVLKKCALLNMIAAGMLFFAPQAHAFIECTGNNCTNNNTHELDALKTMGTTVGKYNSAGTVEESDYETIYITGNPANTNVKEMYSNAGGGSSSAGWLVNYGRVFFGQEPSGSEYITVATQVSDKHNLIEATSSSITPAQGGGVIRNDTSDHNGIGGRVKIESTTFSNNSVSNFDKFNTADSENQYVYIAAGGVLSNVGIYDISAPSNFVASRNSTYINNYSMQFEYADGGAIYNGMISAYGLDVAFGKVVSEGDTFKFNHVGNEDMANAMYATVRDAVTADVAQYITTDWENHKEAARDFHPNGVTYNARGGAIFNAGEFTVTNDIFEYNYAIGNSAWGGAAFNTDRQWFNSDPNADRNANGVLQLIGETVFNGNSALANKSDFGIASGGAIANVGTKLTFNHGELSPTATNILFKDNYAKSKYNSFGGAIYNSQSVDYVKQFAGVVENINRTTFDGNYAEVLDTVAEPDTSLAMGGAIYNASDLTIWDATFATNFVKADDTASNAYAEGGAIANDYGNLYLGIHVDDPGYKPGNIVFTDNHADGRNGFGGAIYNTGGKIDGVITESVIFSGNTDTKTHVSTDRHEVSSAGGAIFGDVGEDDAGYKASNTVFNLSGTGSVVFEYFGQDNVYMRKLNNISATISFIGDNEIPVVRSSDDVSPTAIDEDATRVDLGATFTGEGKYFIQQTQLNLMDGVNGGGTGYIHFDPSIDMKDSVVNMGGTMNSYIYLSSNNDTLDNNDFYITNNKSVLYYADYDSTYRDFTLGNYIENDGLIVYDDMPQNGIAGAMYPDATTSGDTDVKIATTLINRGTVSTATDNFLTKNIHIGTLESEGGQIYINMDNNHLDRTDNEHVLIPEAPEGYDFGTYVGEHYDSEVIVIDNKVTGTTKITFVDMESAEYKQVKLEPGQRIYFAQTQAKEGLTSYKWNTVNAVNSKYEIKIGYDENGTVYDWFLYRDKVEEPTIEPEDMVSITIPRATLEQLRSFRFPLDKTNRGYCNCYKDDCNNSFCRYEEGESKFRLWGTPFYRQGTFDKPFETDFKLAGIDFGLDYQPTTTDLIGVFGSYRYGKYENDGNQKHYGDESKYFSYAGGEYELKSMTGGLYYRKYFDKLYLMGAVYAGKLHGKIKADNGVKGTVKGKHLGAQLEGGYDIKLTRRTTLTPSVRGTYDYIKYDKGHTSIDEEISIGKINSFEIEAALKLEYRFNNERQLPTTGYVKPSVIQTIPDGGKVRVGEQEFTKTLDNETLGRIEVGADTNLTTNFSVGVFGNYTFGSHYDAWGVGGNVRYTW